MVKSSSRQLLAAAILLIAGAVTACRPPSANAPILLFTGTGTSPGDVSAIEAILASASLPYATASSAQLNGMADSQLANYRLLIVPGGNFVEIGNHLTPATAARIRNAVNGGTNYLGICAGGFLAGSFPAPYNSFNLSAGVKFGFYQPGGPELRKAAVKITTPDGQALDHYWESGPQFTGWGDVIGKYPDGTPAIVQGAVGRGWAILTGVHPEAPESWRRGIAFSTPVSDDTAYARMLILAALNRTKLSHY
jgi:glutamine amidotransferase-like uncharacterized protein